MPSIKRPGFCALAFVGISFTLPTAASAQSSQPPPALFAAASEDTPVVIPMQRGIVEQRFVRPNLEVFGFVQPEGDARLFGRRIALELRSGQTLIAAVAPQDAAGSTREAWSGSLEGVDLGRVTFIVDRANGMLAGTISSPEGMYQILPVAGGRHVLMKIDPSLLPPEREPLLGEPLASADVPAPESDTAARVDVMVLYTPAVASAAGGTAAIENIIALSVAWTNQSYANSDIAHRLRLVYQAPVTYTESSDMQTDLIRLQNTADGYMDSIHTARDTYGADLVALLTTGVDACGIGYRPSTSNAIYGFSVSNYTCAPNGTFAHELGHNMGAQHDRFVVSGASATGYNFGYLAPGNQWRTTMAYPDGCGGCSRVQYWSNPNVTHPGTGLPMGIAAGGTNPADNHRTLNESALAVANYRQETSVPGSAVLNTPSGTVGTPFVTYNWNKETSSTWYQLYVQHASGGAPIIDTWYTSANACGASTCSVASSIQLTNGGSYTWWVRTYNGNGYGPWSAAKTFTVSVAVPASATLVSPVGSASTNRPVYTWNAVSSSTWYQIYISKAGTTLLDTWYEASNICDSSVCSAQPALDLTAGSHSWWIRTWNSAGYGPWSSAATFTIGPPGPATLQSPSGSTSAATPIFRWAPASGSTWYYLWITGPGGTVQRWYEAGNICDSTSCSVTSPSSLAVGAHTWWVQTWNSFGYGPWSSGLSFQRVDAPVPPPATLVAPINNSTVHTLTPTFTWNRVSDSSWYLIYVAHQGGVVQQWFQSSAVCGSTTCSITFSDALTAGAGNWWVKTYNDSGDGPWSSAGAFTVSQPVLSAKLTWGASPADLDLHLRTPAIGGTSYHVYYAAQGSRTSAPFAQLDVDDVTGFGPETISIHQSHTGTYRIYVHKFSWSGTLAGSNAQIQLYLGATLLDTFIVPSSGTGDYWMVCDVSNAATGARSCPNTIQTAQPSDGTEATAGAPVSTSPGKLAAIKGGAK